jgi:hypothetical protein
VGHEAARQITAAVNQEHFQQRNISAMGFDESDVSLADFGLNDDRLKIVEILGRLQLQFEIGERDIQTFRDGSEVFLNLNGIIAKQENAEGRVIVDEYAAIAIQHPPARRDDGKIADFVALGPLQVFVGIDDLQLPESDEQHTNHSYDHIGSDGEPLLRQTIIVAKPVRHENPARETL